MHDQQVLLKLKVQLQVNALAPQVLHSMLEKELWKKLPMAQGTVPNLASALEGQAQNGLLAKTGSSSSLSASSSTASQNGNAATVSDGFDVYLAQGNPWRATQGHHAMLCCALLCCAVPCCAVPCCAGLCCAACCAVRHL